MQSKNKYLVIINPISGPRSTKKNPYYIKSFLKKNNLHFDIFISKYKYHIKEYILLLDSKIYTDIIICGGDGTFNEVVNGLLSRTDAYLPRLGFLPGGSGNSVMHDLNATNIDTALKSIINNRIKFIDVMQLEYSNKKEYAINIAGWGLVSDIAYLAEKLRFLGPSRYTVSSLVYILFSKNRPASLIIDNQKSFYNYLFIIISNTVHTGKGMQIAPTAKLDDGLLDINIVKNNITKLQLFKLLPQIFTGKHINSKYVTYLKGKNIKIDFEGIDKLNIDGDIVNGESIKISVIKNILPIYY